MPEEIIKNFSGKVLTRGDRFEQPVGCIYIGNGTCKFNVWAPLHHQAEVHILSPIDRIIPLKKDPSGYFSGVADQLFPGFTYRYRLHDGEYPDPASGFQPQGVHGPSQIVDHTRFTWNDKKWNPPDLKSWIIYELHVGTFTPEGTFNAMIPCLDELIELGVNAIEIMPVAQFPGDRNWGYDGVYIFSVQNSYGTPEDMKNLVDRCHTAGIAVILDMVYNHFGPEGNYLHKFGPYFSEKYNILWGDAINFDGEYADGVRNFFLQNMLYWFENYHIDAMRMDAIHMIYDNSAVHFWEYAIEKAHRYALGKNKRIFFIAESDMNSPKPVLPFENGGWNFDAVWLDDFHHALYTLTDKKGKTYYQDFGRMEQMSKAIKEGFVHTGEYVQFRKRRFGRSSAGIPGEHFICFSQNHDMVGNRMLGERESVLMPFDALKLTAAVFLLAPYIPLLFMGQEYAEENPFLYFVSHSDKDLIEKVKEGRKKNFEKFGFEGEPSDPEARLTFSRSKLNRTKRNEGNHRVMLSWYKTLISLRNTYPAFKNLKKENIETTVIDETILKMKRKKNREELICFFNFSEEEKTIFLPGSRKLILNSEIFSDESPVSNRNPVKRNDIILSSWAVKVFISSE